MQDIIKVIILGIKKETHQLEVSIPLCLDLTVTNNKQTLWLIEWIGMKANSEKSKKILEYGRNIWYTYSWTLSRDPEATIHDLNVNKQRNSITLGQHFFTEIVYLKQRHVDMRSLLFEKLNLSSYAGLSGCKPTCDFTHSWTLIKYLPS